MSEYEFSIRIDPGAVPVEKPVAGDILRQAAETIDNRAAQRDQPNGERTAARAAAAFTALYGIEITAVHVWRLLELVKIARSAYGVYVEDDFLDGVAYAALAAEEAAKCHQTSPT